MLYRSELGLRSPTYHELAGFPLEALAESFTA
jgi:hypothetical protein